MVDVSKMRPGDKLTVEFIIETVQPNDTCPIKAYPANACGNELPYGLKPEYIATHTPAPREFKQGDPVIVDDKLLGTFIAIDNGEVVCRHSHEKYTGNYITGWNPSRVRHADGDGK